MLLYLVTGTRGSGISSMLLYLVTGTRGSGISVEVFYTTQVLAIVYVRYDRSGSVSYCQMSYDCVPSTEDSSDGVSHDKSFPGQYLSIGVRLSVCVWLIARICMNRLPHHLLHHAHTRTSTRTHAY